METMDKHFLSIAKSVGAVEEFYPVLLSRNSLEKTGYLKRSPHQCIFCTDYYNANQESEQFALSPSACFHVYEHYEGQKLNNSKIITLKQNVFREERNKWDEIGRLRDYHVREIVFIGDQAFVKEIRQKIIEKTIDFISLINLEYNLSLATDSFTQPEMRRYKKIQLLKKSKYELSVCTDQGDMALASFNLHEQTFSRPFNIKVRGVNQTVTGCVGFGLERWVFAFISKYGFEPELWPSFFIEG